jgi:hypothetical protein
VIMGKCSHLFERIEFSLKHEVKKLESFYLVIKVKGCNACMVLMDQERGFLRPRQVC